MDGMRGFGDDLRIFVSEQICGKRRIQTAQCHGGCEPDGWGFVSEGFFGDDFRRCGGQREHTCVAEVGVLVVILF